MISNRSLAVVVALLLVTTGFASVAGAGYASPSEATPQSESVVTATSTLGNNTTESGNTTDSGGENASGDDSRNRSGPDHHHKISSEVASLAEDAQADQTDSNLVTHGQGGQTFVKVVIEANSGQGDAAANLARRNGGSVESRYQDLIRVKLPVTAVDAAATSPAVRFVRTPNKVRTNAVTSEGLSNMNATELHQKGYTGENVTVAVVDVDFDAKNSEIAGNVVDVKNMSGGSFNNVSGAHGTAVSELVVDTAPNVSLVLIKVTYEIDMLNAVDYVNNQTDADVASMSLGLSNGPFDGSSQLDNKIGNSVDSGTPWFISAGNEAGGEHLHLNWSDPDKDRVMNFSGSDQLLKVAPPCVGCSASLRVSWDDYPASNEDYDLELYDENGTLIDVSTNVQNGTQAPEELVANRSAHGYLYLRIINVSANGTSEFQIFGNDGTALEYYTNRQSLTRPATEEKVVTVGATDYYDNQLESFSSRGPTQDGQQGVDIVAPDNVTTTALDPFYGTSAAAPHTAGVAALLLDAKNKELTPTEVENTITSTATSINGTEPDSNFGSGLVDAESSVESFSTVYVSNCREIDSSGRYVLDGNLTLSQQGSCIDVNASDVIVEGNGYTIDGGNSTLEAFRIGVEAFGTYQQPLSNVTVRNVTTTNSYYGVIYDNVTASTVENVTATDGGFGFYTWNATDSTFRNVSTVNETYGVWTYKYTKNVTITDATFTASGDTGVYVSNATGVTVEDSTVTDAGDSGFFVVNATGTTITSVAVSGSVYDGVYVRDSPSTTVSHSNVSDNGDEGVSVRRSVNATVRNVTAKRNGDATVYVFEGSDGVEVRNSSIEGSGDLGVQIQASAGAAVRNNTVVTADNSSILISDGATNATVADNVVENATTGVYLFYADSSTVVRNTARDNDWGSVVWRSDDNTLRNNVMTNNTDGLVIAGWSSSNVVRGNDLSSNAERGIGMSDVTGNVLDANNVSANANGTYLDNVTGVTVTNTTAANNSDWAFYARNGSTASVSNYTLTGGESVNFTAHDAALSRNETTPAFPTGKLGVGANVSATNTSAGGWLNVTVGYADRTDWDESSLRLWRHDGSWSEVGSTNRVNRGSDAVTANVTSFGAGAESFTALATNGTVSGCRVINSSGTYELTRNVSTSKDSVDCVNITASNVTFDGMGYTMNATDGSSQHAVVVAPDGADLPLSNVTVRNVTLGHWGEGVYSDGSNLAAGNRSVGLRVSNVTITAGTGGFSVEGAEDATVVDNVVETGDQNTEVMLTFVNNSTVSRNTFSDIKETIVNRTHHNVFANNTVESNADHGFRVWKASNNTFRDNVVSASTFQAPDSDFYVGARVGTDEPNTATNLTLSSGPGVSVYGKNYAVSHVDSEPSPPEDRSAVGVHVNVTVADEYQNPASSWLRLNVSYADSEVTGLNESNLRLWSYDNSTGEWSRVSGMNDVNTAENYVYANVSESEYGVVAAFVAEPNATLNRTAIDFGEMNVDASSNETAVVNVTNDGTAPLEITGTGVKGENESAFYTPPLLLNITVQPGDSQEFTVEYNATALGVQNATFVVAHNASSEFSNSSLTGTGVAPVANVTPTATLAGEFNVTGETDTINVTVRNDGGVALNVTSMTLTGDNVSQYAITSGGSTPVVVAPDGSHEVAVTFDPTSPGNKTVTLSIEHNDTDASPSNVSIGREAVDNTPPVLADATAVNPADDSTVVDGADSVEVTVNVTDNVAGHVDTVTVDASAFGAGTVELANLSGNATYAGSFTVDASNATDGTRSLTITANDTSGNVDTTTTNDVTLDTTNASLDITEPANGTAVNRSWVWVNGTASDAVTNVTEVAIDTPVGSQTATPTDGNWSFNVSSLPDGTHTFTVNATDEAGNVNVTTVNVTVDTSAPNFTLPPGLNRTEGILPEAGLRLAVNVSDGLSGVSGVTAGGVTLENTTSPSAWNTTADVRASPRLGNRTLTVTIRDAAGNANTTTLNYSVGVRANLTNVSNDTFVAQPNDTNLRNVTIVASNVTGNQSVTVGTSKSNPTSEDAPNDTGLVFPQVNTTIPNANVTDGTLNVTVSKDRVEAEYALTDTVTFWVRNATAGTWNATNGTLTAENATHLAYEVETPHFSAYALAAQTETTKPTVSGLSPGDGATVSTNTPTIAADYADAYSGVNTSAVVLKVDGVDVTGDANTTVGATGVEYLATLGDGQHSVNLTVVDEAGNVRVRTWTFSVDTSSSGGGGGGGGGGGAGPSPTVSAALASKTPVGASVEVINGQPSQAARTLLPDGVSAGGVTYTELAVVFAASAGDFALTIEPHAERPSGTSDLVGATPVAYYTVTGGVADAAVQEAELSFTVAENALPADADPEDVAVFRYHEGEWQKLDTTHRGGGEYEASSPGFSAFAVAVTQADVVVTDAALASESVTLGEEASATVTLENQGTREGSRTVEVTADGEVVASQEVTVAAGETKEVTLSWTPESAGTYDVTAGGEAAGSLSVTEAGDGTTTTTDGTTTTPGDADDGIGFGLVVVLVALVVVLAAVVYLWRTGRIGDGGSDGDSGGDGD
jgi:PGF-pre-PGF domain-containing protein